MSEGDDQVSTSDKGETFQRDEDDERGVRKKIASKKDDNFL